MHTGHPITPPALGREKEAWLGQQLDLRPSRSQEIRILRVCKLLQSQPLSLHCSSRQGAPRPPSIASWVVTGAAEGQSWKPPNPGTRLQLHLPHHSGCLSHVLIPRGLLQALPGTVRATHFAGCIIAMTCELFCCLISTPHADLFTSLNIKHSKIKNLNDY